MECESQPLTLSIMQNKDTGCFNIRTQVLLQSSDTLDEPQVGALDVSTVQFNNRELL